MVAHGIVIDGVCGCCWQCLVSVGLLEFDMFISMRQIMCCAVLVVPGFWKGTCPNLTAVCVVAFWALQWGYGCGCAIGV